jgi:hypothetical protein
MFISKYESPPMRFVTDGVLVVGITDGICEITSKWREASKKAAGMTYSKVLAVDFLREMNNYGFEAMNPFLAGEDFVEVTLNSNSHNCKIVEYNFTDSYSNSVSSDEYIASRNFLKQASENNGFSEITEFNPSNTTHKKTDQIHFVDLLGITLGVCVCLVFFIILCMKYVCAKQK